MILFENFLSNAYPRSLTQKRGGGQPLVSFEDREAESCYVAGAAGELDPARAFNCAGL